MGLKNVINIEMSAYLLKQVHCYFLSLTVCSAEQEPAPQLSNCVPMTDDLLALCDGFVENTFLPFVQLSSLHIKKKKSLNIIHKVAL